MKLVIRLDGIGADGLRLDEALGVTWLSEALGEGSPFRSLKPGHLTIDLSMLEDVVHVRGSVDMELEASCSCCLDTMSLDLKMPVEVALFPPEGEPAPRADGELRMEDMGVGTYTGHSVDLAVVVHDQVFLELPMNPRCQETCAGLCPSCGVNLNSVDCRCEKAEDGRWSAFKNIKLN
jgi:uncharacterized protein